jgi:SRSO17 transposase
VKRQYNGNRGKVENCINHVALSYAGVDFHCLLDARLYLPQEWASDPVRRKKTTVPTRLSFRPSSRSRWT